MTVVVKPRNTIVQILGGGRRVVEVVQRGRQGPAGTGGLTQTQIEGLITDQTDPLNTEVTDIKAAMASLSNRRIVTADETYIPASNVVAVNFRAVGGGGGGSGANSAHSNYIGSAGSGGSYIEKFISRGNLEASYTLVVGAGGAAGVFESGTGGNGGDTTITGSTLGTINAKGGQGAFYSRKELSGVITNDRVYGIPPTGPFDVGIVGGASPLVTRLGALLGSWIKGGDSRLGEGGISTNADTNAQPPGYGGGGAGVAAFNFGPSLSQAGGAGVIIIDEYIST